MDGLDLRVGRAARDAAVRAQFEEQAAAARERGIREATPELAALVAGLPGRQLATGACADAEAERRATRRQRLLDAGLVEPAPNTGPRKAWDRVVSAQCWEDAAHETHEGSRKACALVAGWLVGRRGKSLLVLTGEPGRGKTVAGWYALAEGLAGKVPGVTLQGVAMRCGQVMPSPRWDELRDRAERTPLLVLDDVTERLAHGNGWASGVVADLLERRHDSGLRTLVTANLARERLCDVLGARVASRLDAGAVVAVSGADLRGAP